MKNLGKRMATPAVLQQNNRFNALAWLTGLECATDFCGVPLPLANQVRP